MREDDEIQVEGTVIEALSNLQYRVELSSGQRFSAMLSGEMRLSFTQILPGDRVLLTFPPYDLSEARIVSKVESLA